MNKLDEQYRGILAELLYNGREKGDRTGTGTLSKFGMQIRHNMKDGFPLLTTKKMAVKTMMTELKWFLKGDTNIKYLVDNIVIFGMVMLIRIMKDVGKPKVNFYHHQLINSQKRSLSTK